MTDENKIILMTKLALYDKKYRKEDQRRMGYYLEDYLYINNFKTRLSISMVFAMFMAIGALRRLINNFVFPTSLEEFFVVYVAPYLLPWGVTIILYTLISTIIYTKRYRISQKRNKEYIKLLKKLDEYEKQQERRGEAGDEYKRNFTDI